MFSSNHPFFHQISLLAAVLFCAVLQWFFKFNLSAQIIFFLTITLSIGVFHGLLDIILLKQKNFNQPQFLIVYAFSAFASLLFFVQYSGAALVVLLLLSIWHFGESQRFDDAQSKNYTLKRFVLGANAIAAPFVLSNNQLQQVLFTILPNPTWLQLTWTVWAAIAWIWLLAFAVYFLQYLMRKSAAKTDTYFYANLLETNLLEISVVWLSFALLPPLMAFSLYFGAYHAVRHIRDVLATEQVLKNKQLALLGTALVTAWMLGLVLWLVSTKMNAASFSMPVFLSVNLLQATVILLVAITLPHAILISLWRKKYLHKSL